MKILNLSLGQDTGGQQGRLQDAWPRHHPQDEYLSLTSTRTFYPIKHRLNIPQMLKVHIPNAEVLHLNNDLRYLNRFRTLDHSRKAKVIHHHGTMFRTRPDYHLQALKEFKAVGITSTVDLWAIAPDELTWQPQSYELDELQAYRKPVAGIPGVDRPLRVAHAPTNIAIKGTRALERAVRRLQSAGALIELDVIQKVSNQKCLERKGTADVFVDQMLLGYGCNAIEAYGMGIPVIAGVDPERCPTMILQKIPMDTPDRMLQLWGSFPFMESTEDGLYVALTKMLDKKVRDRYSHKGMAHFLRFHEASVSTTALRTIYSHALGI